MCRLILHCGSSSGLHKGFQLSLEAALSWVGLDTDPDPASTLWEVSPPPPSLFLASSILSLTSSAQQTSHVPWVHPSLEPCWWLNNSCCKIKWCLPSFRLTLLSQVFSFCFRCYCLALLSSASYITAAFTLASGHLGLEIKMLYYCMLYSTVQ